MDSKFKQSLEDARVRIRKTNEGIFSSAGAVLDFSIEAMEHGVYVGRKRSPFITHAVTALYTKCLRLYRSTLLLAENGLLSECFALNRIAFESLLYLMWIHQEEDQKTRSNRSRDLLAWQLVAREKTMTKILEEPGECDARLERTFADLKSFLSELKASIPPDEWEDFRKNGPYRQSRKTEDLAKAVGMEIAYNRIYKIGSEIVHCQDLVEYAERDPKTGCLTINDIDEKRVTSAIGSAILIQFVSITIINRLLRLDLSDNLRIFNENLRKQYPDIAALFPVGWHT